MSGYIAVDLDGTLAHYDKWRGIEHVGPPVPAMVERVKRWLEDGRTVKIFTARMSCPPAEVGKAREAIQDWCERQGLPRLEVTNIKTFGLDELWDDRAVQVIPNTGEPVGQSRRGLT